MAEVSSQTVLAHSLRRIQVWLQGRLALAVEEAGLPLEEWWVLHCLADRPARPMSEIARYVMMPGPSLTKLVDRMVDQGFVYRRPDAVDRRRVLLYPTVRGLELHARVAAAVTAEETALAEAVGADTLADLRAAVDRFAARLD